jgi:Ca2+-binding EF-hand superfamily protein
MARAQFIAEMDSQFHTIDTDKSGQLTRPEIEQFDKLSADARAKARNRALFAQLDTNKNGQLSPTEFAALTPPSVANPQPMLTREDLNRDGQISLVEHRSAALANFDRLDTDKNGVVSLTEMKAAGIGASPVSAAPRQSPPPPPPR